MIVLFTLLTFLLTIQSIFAFISSESLLVIKNVAYPDLCLQYNGSGNPVIMSNRIETFDNNAKKQLWKYSTDAKTINNAFDSQAFLSASTNIVTSSSDPLKISMIPRNGDNSTFLLVVIGRYPTILGCSPSGNVILEQAADCFYALRDDQLWKISPSDKKVSQNVSFIGLPNRSDSMMNSLNGSYYLYPVYPNSSYPQMILTAQPTDNTVSLDFQCDGHDPNAKYQLWRYDSDSNVWYNQISNEGQGKLVLTLNPFSNGTYSLVIKPQQYNSPEKWQNDPSVFTINGGVITNQHYRVYLQFTLSPLVSKVTVGTTQSRSNGYLWRTVPWALDFNKTCLCSNQSLTPPR